MNVRWLYSHRILMALLVTATVAVGLMTVLVIRQQQDQANGQVYLEAGGSVGSNPFVPLLSPPATASGDRGGGDTSIQTDVGADYRPACDAEKLITYLTKDPQAGAAWVHALNSDRDLSWSGGSKIETLQIPAYIRELTPRVLTEDLRVTNYQFTNGTALAVQSILEKGTGILVDAKGVARVRCSSGNPLTPMVQQKTPPIYRGKPWPSFQPQRVVATQRSPQCGGGEYYDGARCQQVSVCPDSKYVGDGGRCYGRANPEPADDAKRPDMHHWSDQPASPQEPRPPEQAAPEKPRHPQEPRHPEQPASPQDPRHPEQPIRSEEPREPEQQPVRPEQPRYPGQPARPEEPREPEQPVRPEQPRYPGQPARPEEPREPEQPVRPEQPRHPDQPVRAEKPTRPDKPQRSDDSQHPDKPGRPPETKPPDKLDPSDKSKDTGNPAHGNKQDKPEHPGKAKRVEKSVRPDKPVKSNKAAKPERDVSSDRGDSPE
jgi:hypothetical protein